MRIEVPRFQYLGIRKLAASLPKWLDLAKRPAEDLGLCALLMERAHERFADSAGRWTRVAKHIDSAARTGQGAHLREAADQCRHIADIEVAAMKILARI